MLLVSLGKCIDRCVLLRRFIDLRVPHVNKSIFFFDFKLDRRSDIYKIFCSNSSRELKIYIFKFK